MIKSQLYQQFLQALGKAAPDLNNLAIDNADVQRLVNAIKVDRPRNVDHGDYAVNVSPLAKFAKMGPPQIATTLKPYLESPDYELTIIAGFVNFKLKNDLLSQALIHGVRNEKLGKNQSMKGESVHLEYVSANPTGPLHIGHGRWAAVGNSLQRIFEHCGAMVSPEFYVNDAGVQMNNLANSIAYRACEVMGTGVSFPTAVEGEPFPFYPGEYITDLAKEMMTDWQNSAGEQETLSHLKAWSGELPIPQDIADKVKAYARERMIHLQKDLLNKMGVPFDYWYYEKQELYASGLVDQKLAALKATNYVYEQDGAIWLRSSALGDEKDRVLVKSDGNYTYLTPDIAYHDHKFVRPGPDGKPYTIVMNIWGADHHGYIPRMKAALQALEHDVNRFEVVVGQLVNLIIDGQKERMGKRRKMLTLEDVVNEVGVDATRFWMVSKSTDTALDFDMDLAASQTDENPVFYVQYAHARCCSILRNALQPAGDITTGEATPPMLTQEKLDEFINNLSIEQLKPLFEEIGDEKANETLKNLVFMIDSFEAVIQDAAKYRAPHLVARYTLDLASGFHSFYNVCRVLTNREELTLCRLMVIIAVQRTLAQGLELLGVSAPESM